MIILFVLGLLLGAVAVVFAWQNIAVVTVTFFSWQINGSLAIIIELSILSGIIIVLLLVLPKSISNYINNKKLKNEILRLEEELRKQRELTHFAKHTPPTEAEIEKIEESAIDPSGRI